MKRPAMSIIAGLTLIVLSEGMQTVSSGAAGGSAPGRLEFDDAAQQLTLTIPTPACVPGHEGRKWVLFVNEPRAPGKPVVGSVTGSTGVLTVKYPPDFCGVLQADARTGPPYVQVYGLLHTVDGSKLPTGDDHDNDLLDDNDVAADRHHGVVDPTECVSGGSLTAGHWLTAGNQFSAGDGHPVPERAA